MTENDIALKFSHDLVSSTEGNFSIDFMPTVYYPNGGIITLRILQDDTTYYQIQNTDNYGVGEISKYINNIKVDSKQFDSEYTQGVSYTITVIFSPSIMTVEAFGQTLTMNNNTVPITVSKFSVNTVQQDAFYDNIVYQIIGE